MPRYHYDGRDASGKKVQGVIDAQSDGMVAKELKSTGITPINIYAETAAPQAEDLAERFKIGYPTLEDLAFLSRQLYSMNRSGVPIVRAIRVVSESVKNDILKQALLNVVTSVQEGQSLSVAMRQHPRIFPNLMVALVSVGENTGSLEEVFLQISLHFERELEIRKRIKAATRYPTIVIVVIALAVVIINIFVIPAFAAFFKQFNAQLPLPTRILIGISDFMVHNWFYMLLGIILLSFSWFSYIRTPAGRYNWDKYKLRIPFIGNIIYRGILARYARAFALCLKTGVPLLESIGLIANATDNVYVAEKINTMRSSIEHGESLTSAAITSKMFSPLVIQMLAIGEETGEIDRLINEVAAYYEQEVDYDVKRLGDLIEPIILGILGVMVLILALGVYLPMWSLSQAAFGR